MINIITSSRYKIGKASLKQEAQRLLAAKGLTDLYTLNIVFVGRNKMRTLQKKYKDEEGILPILTFSYNERTKEGVLLGEVVICYPQAVLLAAERNKKVNDTIISLIDHGIDNLIKSA